MYATTVCAHDTHFPEKDTTTSPSLYFDAMLIRRYGDIGGKGRHAREGQEVNDMTTDSLTRRSSEESQEKSASRIHAR